MQATGEIFCVSTASQMKKKRKSRWKNGVIRRKKSCSHLNSKDNPNTAESGDGEEDEEEEDVKLAESEDPEKMKDVECESMEVDECARAEGPTDSTEVVQNNISESWDIDNTTSTVDEVVSVETVQNNVTDVQNDVQASENTEPKRTEPIAEDSSGMG